MTIFILVLRRIHRKTLNRVNSITTIPLTETAMSNDTDTNGALETATTIANAIPESIVSQERYPNANNYISNCAICTANSTLKSIDMEIMNNIDAATNTSKEMPIKNEQISNTTPETNKVTQDGCHNGGDTRETAIFFNLPSLTEKAGAKVPSHGFSYPNVENSSPNTSSGLTAHGTCTPPSSGANKAVPRPDFIPTTSISSSSDQNLFPMATATSTHSITSPRNDGEHGHRFLQANTVHYTDVISLGELESLRSYSSYGALPVYEDEHEGVLFNEMH